MKEVVYCEHMKWSEIAQDYKCEYGILVKYCAKKYCSYFEPQKKFK